MRIGVIDIGSNSIKLLVAETGSSLAIRYETTWETRIGTTVASADGPLLSSTAIRGACEAVQSLIREADDYHVEHFVIAATSAVRDAGNSDEFIAAIQAATGHRVRVLTGDEEAAYIGWGVASDPVLGQYPEFCLADLGGGSLELIHLRKGDVIAKTSLPLGAVRLSQQLLEDPHLPMRPTEMRRIVRRVRKTIEESGFQFPTDCKILAGTGGGLAVARAIRASWLGQDPTNADHSLSLTYLRFLYIELAAMSLEERIRIPVLGPQRADIMPTALIVLLTVAELSGAASYIFSDHNLRYGIVAKFLSDQGPLNELRHLREKSKSLHTRHTQITTAQEIAPGN